MQSQLLSSTQYSEYLSLLESFLLQLYKKKLM